MGKRETHIIKWLVCVTIISIVFNILTISYFQNQASLKTTMVFKKLVAQSFETPDYNSDSDELFRRFKKIYVNIDNSAHTSHKPVLVRSDVRNDVRTADSGKRTCGEEVEEYEMKDDVIDAMVTNLSLFEVFPEDYHRLSPHDLARALGAKRRKSAKKPLYYSNLTRIGRKAHYGCPNIAEVLRLIPENAEIWRNLPMSEYSQCGSKIRPHDTKDLFFD